jgi:APA family basic amino acid/polyamine antiporter
MAVEKQAQSIGIWMTSSLVVGTMIGSGIFLLPVNLAPLGVNAIIGWVLSALGAICIAFSLSRLVRQDGAGIQSYVESVFGPTAGFIVTWEFWISCWTAVAATAIATAAALARIFPALNDPWWIAMVSILSILVVQVVNARGVRAAGGLAVVTVLIKILPLLAVVAVVVLRKGSGQPLSPLAPLPVTFDNVATAVTLTLFAMLGFEAATAPVCKVRNPQRTIPLSIVAGTVFVALIYLFSSTAVSLILSPAATASSPAPYADALVANFGESAAIFSAMTIAVAAFGALNNNVLVGGELGYSMALRRDLPKQLAHTDKANAPIVSQFLCSALAIVLVLLNGSKSTADLFTFVLLLVTTSTLILYLIGALAAWRRDSSLLTRITVPLSVVFALFAFYGAGLEANLWGLLLLIAGLAVRWLCHRFTRSQDGSTPAAAERAA